VIPPGGQFSYPLEFTKGDAFLKKAAKSALKAAGVSSSEIVCYWKGQWFKAESGTHFPMTFARHVLYREMLREGGFVEVSDTLNHPSYKFLILDKGAPMLRYLAAMPIFEETTIVGAIILADCRRQDLHGHALENIKNLAVNVAGYLSKR
jgi:hypothetical protein